MKPPDTVSDELLDRLVDNELEEPQREKLLRQLELHPEGWRRCAWAFLEAQTWSSSLRGLASPTLVSEKAQEEKWSAPIPSGAAVDVSGRTAVGNRASWSWLSLAASGLVAFSLGWLSQELLLRVQPASKRIFVETSNDPGSVAERSDETQLVESPAEAFENAWAADAPFGTAAAASGAYRELFEALRREGHQIQRRRGLLPALEDGRATLVPVEDYYIVPDFAVTY
jgi:hypothetical protein